MEYDNTDKNIAYKTACENVKKIANAIKSIRIKYYLDFSKITEQDKKIYQELHSKIDEISQEQGLEKLKIELIRDIESKYNGVKKADNSYNKDLKDPEVRQQYFEEIKQAYFGAMDVESQALREGKSDVCLECQKKREKYIEIFRQNEDGKQFEREVIMYTRGILGELTNTREKTQNRNQEQMKFFSKCHENTKAQDRKEASSNIIEVQKEQTNKTQQIQPKEEIVLE